MKKKESTKENKKARAFTVTEVGTLLENMGKDIRQIAEGHVGLDRRLEKLEVSVHGNSRRLDMIELGFQTVNGRLDRLEDAVSKLSKDLKETRQELKGEIAQVKIELKGDIRDLGNRLAAVETSG